MYTLTLRTKLEHKKRENYIVFLALYLVVNQMFIKYFGVYFEVQKLCSIFVIMDNLSIEKVENAVCRLFRVSREDLYSKSLKQQHSDARHYLWHALHCAYGMSNTKISRRYGRTRETVIQYITQMKFRVAHQKDGKEIYDILKNALNTEDYGERE